MNLATWLGFLAASIVIAATPGPGAVASMSAGIRYGYWAALALILGLQGAILLQIAVVALGLGALLTASETAFEAIKFIGAAYLVWLGLQKWRASPAEVATPVEPRRRQGFFLQGLLVNLTNPKAIIFIAALVPQFVDPTAAQLPQYGLIATTLCGTDLLVMSGYALVAARIGRWLPDPESQHRQNRCFGTLFIVAGTLLAFSRRHS